MPFTGRFFFPGKLRHVIGLIRSFASFYRVVFELHTGFDGDHQLRAEGRAVRICRALIGLEFLSRFLSPISFGSTAHAQGSLGKLAYRIGFPYQAELSVSAFRIR